MRPRIMWIQSCGFRKFVERLVSFAGAIARKAEAVMQD